MMFLILGIILILIGVGGTLLLIHSYRFDEMLSVLIQILGYALGGMFLLIFTIGYFSSIRGNKTIYNKLQSDHEILTIQYETALGSGDLIVISQVYEGIRKYNNQIIEHQNYIDSIWTGIFYSKDIANLPLIKITK